MALWTPAEITTSIFESSITSDANGVSSWNDASGNNRHAEQSNNAYKPSVDGDAILFDDSDEKLRISSFSKTTQSIFMVVEPNDATFVLFGSGSVSFYGLTGVDGNTTDPISSGLGSPTYRLDGEDVTWTTRDAVHDALNGGIHLVEIVGATLTNFTAIDIGYFDGSYLQYSFQGKFYKFIVIDGSPSADVREHIEGWALWDVGAQANLNPSHRFYSAAPVTYDSLSAGFNLLINHFLEAGFQLKWKPVPALSAGFAMVGRCQAIIKGFSTKVE